ncbi:glycyl-radical enzyme activating protein [Carboxydocella sp. ULO1]|uniref:glycyl-radical enzyme activating protein n=1 Tax=Carboxydocella sp. ULO1 TaxID=1926599 RepID=UPI0009ACF409|nr:glycyl-radical enzyme activating protein [Carboxydocella sp. ULO1]
MKSGLIFNIQKFSLQDGPGIRTTVFFLGCPLRCQWCHNPESQSFHPRLLLATRRCIGCGRCQFACPHQATRERSLCQHCGHCATACPTLARKMVGRRVTVSEVMDTINQDRVFYEESGGGVTFSGGEPLAQPDFLLALLQTCRKQALHTAVDTSGYAPLASLEAIAPYTDLFLYDLKLLAEEKHRYFTGVSNQLILSNLKWLVQQKKNFFLRLPIIPGITDTDEQITLLQSHLQELGQVKQINLLPYHALAQDKYRRLGQPYPLEGTPEPSPEQMQAIAEALKPYCEQIQIGG